jgi:hypothetical protein
MNARICLLILCSIWVAGCSNQDSSQRAVTGGPVSRTAPPGVEASRPGEAKEGMPPESFRERLLEIARTYLGVKETSRLISRLRYRQFGIFVTTSYVSLQAYKEIKEDGHPVLIISSGDIARLLVDNGYGTTEDVQQWLVARFPKAKS